LKQQQAHTRYAVFWGIAMTWCHIKIS
jgi:hypothetical protein